MVKWKEVLKIVDVAKEYFESQNVRPTLRTLFYYLVSKEIIPNTVSSYKRLSRILVEARKDGRYSWNFLEDKTRRVLGQLLDDRFSDDTAEDFSENVKRTLEKLDIDEMIRQTFDYKEPTITVDKWSEQPTTCEIWIEKEALASTVENWISGSSIPIRINKGYSSWTFIYNNAASLAETLKSHEKVIIFYLGDLDPSGMDIQRFIMEALNYFGLYDDQVEFRRLAITGEHVEEFDLPPRPKDAETLAKLARDPRSATYAEKYIVELDALVAYAPSDFKAMITGAIDGVWDEEIYEDLRAKADEVRKEVEEILSNIKTEAKDKIMNDLKGD